MNNELAVVRDLRRKVQIASALEEAGRFDEADQMWAEMERIASSDGMVKTAQGKLGLLERLMKGLGKAGRGIRKEISPAMRTRRNVIQQMRGLVPEGETLQKAAPRAVRQQAVQEMMGGAPKAKVGDLGEITRPSRLYTHGPAAAAGAAGAAGIYGLGKMRGGAGGYEKGSLEGYGLGKMKGRQEGERAGYRPEPSPGAYYPTGAGGSGRSTASPERYEGGPIVGPVPGSQGPDTSGMIGDIEQRLRRVEQKIGEIEQSFMAPSKPAPPAEKPAATPPSQPASTPSPSSKPSGPPKEA
jgi:hypothetical protein